MHPNPRDLGGMVVGASSAPQCWQWPQVHLTPSLAPSAATLPALKPSLIQFTQITFNDLNASSFIDTGLHDLPFYSEQQDVFA